MEDYIFMDEEGAIKKSQEIGFNGDIHKSTTADGGTLYFPAKTEDEFISWYRKNDPDAESELSAAKDPRKTPAPPEDRKKGSKKNPKDSAKDSKGGIKFTEAITKSLKNKVSEHNEKSDRKVTLGMLKAVYRRGAGAYSVSHRPGVSRGAWAMARVNAFLKLVKSGKPSNSKYTQDNDLLPKGHPKKANEEGCNCMKTENYEAAEPTPKDDETHSEYMSRCQEMGYSEEECMKAHEGHKFSDQDEEYDVEGYGGGGGGGGSGSGGSSCGAGKEMRNGKCVKVAFEIDVQSINVEDTIIKADTGEYIVVISGIAFHEGINKNGWEITRAGANLAVSQMVGADLTLNHPKANQGRFSRNMDGGVDEAIVGFVTEAHTVDKLGGTWEVRFKAEVHRKELFEALESGMWLREGYGVSIGGSGIPDEVIEAEDGSMVMKFETDFSFDHLAIVHRPAYAGAKIQTVEKVKLAESAEVFNSHIDSVSINATGKDTMSDEEIIIEASEEEVVIEAPVAEEVTPDFGAEIEALKASLAERDAEIEAFKASEAEKLEAARMSLVSKANDLGMSGHEELPSETLESLIASWESKIVVETPVKEMAPVASTAEASENVVKVEESTEVVANYLNRKLVKTPESVYAKAWNAWAKGWNQTLSASEKEIMRAPTYEEAKENNQI